MNTNLIPEGSLFKIHCNKCTMTEPQNPLLIGHTLVEEPKP